MPLHFIIDAYNVIRHASFGPPGKIKDEKPAFIEYVKRKRLCGSPKNRTTFVFDGFPDKALAFVSADNIDIVFSREEDADERIKRLAEKSANPRNIVVVSDDREIKLFVKSCGARVLGVEEFINAKEGKAEKNRDMLKPELSSSQIQSINQELKGLWLKQ